MEGVSEGGDIEPAQRRRSFGAHWLQHTSQRCGVSLEVQGYSNGVVRFLSPPIIIMVGYNYYPCDNYLEPPRRV